jgi:hypothetical protein
MDPVVFHLYCVCSTGGETGTNKDGGEILFQPVSPVQCSDGSEDVPLQQTHLDFVFSIEAFLARG